MTDEKSLAFVLAEIKDELKTFVQTRAQLLRAETTEKLRAWKRPFVLLVLAAVFLLSGWFALVFCLVALFHSWLVSANYEWFLGALIVGGMFLSAGAVCGSSGYRRIKSSRLTPDRTLKIIKQDQEWIKRQTRSV